MLYEITFTPDDDEKPYQSVIVESPKCSRFGIVRDELLSWATETFAGQYATPGLVEIAAYNPARIGYKSGNESALRNLLYEIPVGFPQQLENTDDVPAEHRLCDNPATACAECVADALQEIDDAMLRYAL